MSSTPTGARSKFYYACTDPNMGYTEHYHPSTHNPNWSQEMEEEFRAQLSEQGYIHEVLAEFGSEDSGVFNKDKLDQAMLFEDYYYHELTLVQKSKIKEDNRNPSNYIFENEKPYTNHLRTIGIDWDKYGASSSIVVLDYDQSVDKFKVLKRIEVPKADYSYDYAVNLIVHLNELYNPSWIYCDRGAGEYQIERLHIIGDERPETGLKHKVKGIHFGSTIEVINPITKEIVKEPIKPFMVNQLTICFERDRMMMSRYDEVLHKQLIDYEVVRVGKNGPVFTDENEHFVDALGLSYLAFVQEFKDLTRTVKEVKTEMLFSHMNKRDAKRELYSNPSTRVPNPNEEGRNWVRMESVNSFMRNNRGNTFSRERIGNITRSMW